MRPPRTCSPDTATVSALSGPPHARYLRMTGRTPRNALGCARVPAPHEKLAGLPGQAPSYGVAAGNTVTVVVWTSVAPKGSVTVKLTVNEPSET